jgi:response regulator of citrate/malate metabolism
MKLRRRFIAHAKGNKTYQKCLALALILKTRLKHSRINHYTINKLCSATGISHRTAEKYEKWMKEYDFIHFEGTGINRVMIVNRIASHTSNRNICIDEMDLSTFFNAYRSIQAFIFMRIQHNKDFLRQLLQSRHNPDSTKEFRTAKRKVKDLVAQRVLKSVDDKYREYGLGLDKIAKNVGCCVRTAQRVVKYSIRKMWIEKTQNFEWIYAPHVNHRQIEGFTFSTKHKLCIAHPNTYSLSSSISLSLSHGMV